MQVFTSLAASQMGEYLGFIRDVLSGVGGLSAIVLLVRLYLYRKKPSADVDHINADTQKSKADAADKQAEAWLKILGQMERSTERVEIEVVNLRKMVKTAEDERDALIEWKREHEPYIDELRRLGKSGGVEGKGE